MKIVDTANATGTLAEYAAEIEKGAILVTTDGRPIAALVPIENTDLETASLSTNPQFLELIERSRARVRNEGGVSLEEMRKRFG
jgi:antitoxin (DNA-binding transcriptional repressor) of toxin-antitoxin stability system